MSLYFQKPLIYMPRKRKKASSSTPETQVLQNVKFQTYYAYAGSSTAITNAIADITYAPQALGSAWVLSNQNTSAFNTSISRNGLHIVVLKNSNSVNLTTYANRLRWGRSGLSLSGASKVYALYVGPSSDVNVYKIKGLVTSASDQYNCKSYIQDTVYTIPDTTVTPNGVASMQKLQWSSQAIENIETKVQSIGTGALILIGLMNNATLSDADALVIANEINGHNQFGAKTTVVDLNM